MLKIKLKVLPSKLKELTAVEYEYSNGVVFPQHLRGKKLYFSPSQVNHKGFTNGHPYFYLYIARKFDATGKLTSGVTTPVLVGNGGKFYDWKDYRTITATDTYRAYDYYTLKKRPLLRYHLTEPNRYLNTQRKKVPEYLIAAQNVNELNEIVYFSVVFYGKSEGESLQANNEIEIFLNIYEEEE